MGEAAAIGFMLGTKPASLPELYVPVLINFPLPAWATRGEEVDDQDLDRVTRESTGKF